MKSCKSVCLVEGCTSKPIYFVNLSRFHLVCETHLNGASQNDTQITCQNCKIPIKCLKEIDFRVKSEYKHFLEHSSSSTLASPHRSASQSQSSVSLPKTNSQSKSLNSGVNLLGEFGGNCSERNCKSKGFKVCNIHIFCNNHLKIKDDFTFCHKCKCRECKTKYGVYIRKCGEGICENCLKTTDCCIVCCKRSTKKLSECQHFVCQDHSKIKFCPCKNCGICKVKQAKDRNCGHLVCTGCEVRGCCPDCITGECNSCKGIKPVFKYKCGLHSYCTDCTENLKKCTICPSICVRCNVNEVDSGGLCANHPLCNDCLSNFSQNLCVYCKGKEDYTCQYCEKTFDSFQETTCGHKVCSKCCSFNNDHFECGICIKEIGFCIECYPNNFCKSCRKSEKNWQISCNHGFCSECGPKEEDEHYYCKVCKNTDHIKEGVCLKCERLLCEDCHKSEAKKLESCEHVICDSCISIKGYCQLCVVIDKCNYCEELRDIFPGTCLNHKICFKCIKVWGKDYCIFCTGEDINYKCDYCLFYYRKLEILQCNHKACAICLLAEGNKCELCIECSICKKVLTKASLECNHSICQNCINTELQNPCLICNNDYIACKTCASYKKSKLCNNKHLICEDCSNHNLTYLKLQCLECTPFCLYCRENVPSDVLECRHTICSKCYSTKVKDGSSCLLCDTNTQRYCSLCFKVPNRDSLFDLECGHKYCDQCFDKDLCVFCKPRNYCMNCKKKSYNENISLQIYFLYLLNGICHFDWFILRIRHWCLSTHH